MIEDNGFSVGDFLCKCSVNCMAPFTKDDVDTHILTIREMTKDEKEMYIMGVSSIRDGLA